jgi:L-amino acid N-acyltransferase
MSYGNSRRKAGSCLPIVNPLQYSAWVLDRAAGRRRAARPEVDVIEVREAAPADLEAMLTIYNDAVVNTTAVYDYAPRSPEAQTTWFESKRNQRHPVLVAVAGQTVVGFTSYGPFRPWPAYQHTVENAIYIAPGHRGRGIGTQLLRPLITIAQQRGYHAMVAGIDATNEASLRLHRKLGFEQVGHFRQVGWKFERWLDLVFLERLL